MKSPQTLIMITIYSFCTKEFFEEKRLILNHKLDICILVKTGEFFMFKCCCVEVSD